MTPAQRKLIELDKRKPEIKAYYEELRETLAQVAEEIGVEGFFQDGAGNPVYQVIKPQGRFVQFEDLAYIRTKLEDEKRGELSKKKAEEAGFDVG